MTHPAESMSRDRMAVVKRRAASLSGVAAAAVGLIVLAPLLLPALAVADLLRARLRLPLIRLYLFGICWAWLEIAGVTAATGLWLTGHRHDVRVHYRLQAWWADRLMGALRVTCGLEAEVDGVEALQPGPTVLLVRHASLADSLLTAWAITSAAGTGLAPMRPRVVMKRELLVDPCLDVVGNRLPNCFVDRSAADSLPELAAIAQMADGLATGDVAVIFPEGTRANPTKRQRALARIAGSDPQRAQRLAPLSHLLPPRPAGAAALLRATPDAEVCVGWHIGFEGLDTFSGIIAALGLPRSTVRLCFRRLERAQMPPAGPADADGRPPADFVRWLDETWLELDADVDALLG